MIGNVDKRCVEIGEYIRDTGATVRRAAAVFGISKSTVHIDVTKRLYDIDRILYDQVKAVFGNKQGAKAHTRRKCHQRKIQQNETK